MNPFAARRYIIASLMILLALALIFRLALLQLIDPSYKLSADNNSRRYVTQYPARGIIYDRNGIPLVANQAAYDLMIDLMQIKPFDTTELCRILGITKEQLNFAILKSPERKSRHKPYPIFKQLSAKTYAILQEELYKFPGFFVQPRTLRSYPKPIAAHLLGYVGEVDSSIIKANPYYKMGDYIGISGLEKSYEKYLRGQKGVSILLVDVHNRIKGSFLEGRYDTAAVIGSDLTCTIDSRIQEYGEYLMQHFRGSIVAIEPSTGEILCLVSSPTYDPSLLVGRERRDNVRKLQTDSTNPLFNRALMAKYPPGSTFKLVNGLIGLKEGVVRRESRYSCSMGFHLGNVTLKCHDHRSPLNFYEAIGISCNAYFCNVFRSILDNPKYSDIHDSYAVWRNYVTSFGFGSRLGSDFPNELSGYIPTTKYYDKYFGRNGWKSITIRSLSIGQGEIGITPLQMCNFAATVANRGFYFTPHVVKGIAGDKTIDKRFTTPNYTPFDTALYGKIIEGMEYAVTSGTSRVARLPDIVVCAKTGTAENPHGKDHSIFITFAPKDNPKIAIAVYLENSGFGSTYAAPIASLIMEKYLTDSISRPLLEEAIIKKTRKDE